MASKGERITTSLKDVLKVDLQDLHEVIRETLSDPKPPKHLIVKRPDGTSRAIP